MALDFYSKHGIIIAIVTILASLLISITETHRVETIFRPDGYYSSRPLWDIVVSVATYILVLLAGVFSFVLIFGIVKKRHLLVAPWLVIGFLLAGLYGSTILYETVRRSYFRLSDYVPVVIVIGLEIIVLYPMCHLYNHIRNGNAAVGKPKILPTKSIV